MTAIALYAANVIAIALLIFAFYLPRHHRREMALAFLGINVGVLAVSATLASATISATTAGAATGLGIGLFGVLSIIRLRSDELAHRDVAYYFGALTLALLGGLGSPTSPIPYAFMVAVLAVFAIADHPRFTSNHESQIVILDRAITDPTALLHHLEHRLAATVTGVRVRKVDLANDMTEVEVQLTRRISANTLAEQPHRGPYERTTREHNPFLTDMTSEETNR